MESCGSEILIREDVSHEASTGAKSQGHQGWQSVSLGWGRAGCQTSALQHWWVSPVLSLPDCRKLWKVRTLKQWVLLDLKPEICLPDLLNNLPGFCSGDTWLCLPSVLMRMADCKSLTWVWPGCFLEALWYGVPPLPEVQGFKERTFRGQLRRDWLLHSTCLCVPAVVFIPSHLSLGWLLWARSYCLPVPLRSPQGRWKWNEVNIVPTSLFLIMCFLLKWPMMRFVWAQMEELGGLAFEQRFLNLISSNSLNDEKFFSKTEGSGLKAHGPISLWQQASALPNNSEKNLCRLRFLSRCSAHVSSK